MNDLIIIIIILIIVVVGMSILYLAIGRQISALKRLRDNDYQRFDDIAARSLKNNADILENIGRKNIDSLIAPLRTRIEDFTKNLGDQYTEAVASRRSLEEQIDRLSNLNMSLGKDTRRLADALKGNNKFQGKWGETILESILENAGFVKGVHFISQVTSESDKVELDTLSDKKVIRPDVILLLPQEKKIIIDSKAPITAYIDYYNAESEQEAEKAKSNHVAAVKRHIDTLSSKNYSSGFKNALNQVLLFIPNDAALFLAVSCDPSLPEYAANKNITLVSPLNLMSVVQILNEIWLKEYQNRNAIEIARMGALLYEAASSIIADMKNIERALSSAEKAYQSAFRRICDSPRSLMARAEKLREMGVKAENRKRVLND